MRNVGIIVNITKDSNLDITASIIKWVESKGGRPMLAEDISMQIGKPGYGYTTDYIYKNSDFVIVLGGDGTILGVAREAAEYETPLLGVNLGHLGFLAELEVKEVFKCLEIVFNGNIMIERRMMLQASICKDDAARDFYALNDIVITRGNLSRIVTVDTYIDNDYVTTISGDGLIIATPTGSTAYSLSAGGPIISPNLASITLTPICPHSLFSRSIVIAEDETVKVDLKPNRGDAFLTIDGQEGYRVENGEYVLIKKAPLVTNLIKLANKSFYEVLRTKLTER